MQSMQTFARDDVAPSWWANALGRVLSLLSSQLVLMQADATHVTLPATANSGAVVAIGGLWRYVEAPITVAHPGGPAGAYPLFATAAANRILSAPQPFTDATNYAFGLTIQAPGASPPTVAGTLDVYRHIADVHWDGAQITRIDQLVPAAPLHSGAHAAGGSDPLSPADIGAIAAGDSHSLQTGDIVWSGATARPGAVLCDGGNYARADPRYAALFARISTRYGAGDGATTFGVPNLLDRVAVGASASRPLGAQGGAGSVTLMAANLPVHQHAFGGTTTGESQHHTHPFDTGTVNTSNSDVFAGRFAAVHADDHQFSWSYAVGNTTGKTSATAAESGWLSSDGVHSHPFRATGVTTANGIDHTHAFSGSTDGGPGSAAPIGLYPPNVALNPFILL